MPVSKASHFVNLLRCAMQLIPASHPEILHIDLTLEPVAMKVLNSPRVSASQA